MPIYEFHCDLCKRDFEELVFNDSTPPCPECGADKTHKLMSRPCRHRDSCGGDYSGDYSGASAGSSGGGCGGCSGGNCASCH